MVIKKRNQIPSKATKYTFAPKRVTKLEAVYEDEIIQEEEENYEEYEEESENAYKQEMEVDEEDNYEDLVVLFGICFEVPHDAIIPLPVVDHRTETRPAGPWSTGLLH